MREQQKCCRSFNGKNAAHVIAASKGLLTLADDINVTPTSVGIARAVDIGIRRVVGEVGAELAPVEHGNTRTV